MHNEAKEPILTDTNRLKTAHSLFASELVEEALSMLNLVEEEAYRNCEEYLRLELSCLVFLERYSEVEMLARALIEKHGRIFQAPWLALIAALQNSGRQEEADAVFWETFRYWPNDPRLSFAVTASGRSEN